MQSPQTPACQDGWEGPATAACSENLERLRDLQGLEEITPGLHRNLVVWQLIHSLFLDLQDLSSRWLIFIVAHHLCIATAPTLSAQWLSIIVRS
jgi:hypothetical protein